MFKGTLLKSTAMIALMAVLNLVVGCSSDSTSSTNAGHSGSSGIQEAEASPLKSPLTLELGQTTVNLSKAYFVNQETSVEVEFSVDYGGSDPETRIMKLSTGDEKFDEAGGSGIVSIERGDGTLLYEFEVAGDTLHPHSLWFTERTATDTLTVHRTRLGEHVTERYECNGETYELAFTKSEIDAYNSWCGARPAGRDTPELTRMQIADKGWDFDKFEQLWDYVDRSSTLFDNRDGEVLMKLLNDSVFVQWLMDQLGLTADESKEMPDWIMGICAAAAFVAAGKCPFAAVLNPACDLALATLGACVIIRILYDVFG